MKKRILVIVIAAVAACIGMFTALNHVSSTPPVIAGKTVSKMQALQSVTGELTVDYDGTISYMGIGGEIGINADLEVQMLTGENLKSHETGTAFPIRWRWRIMRCRRAMASLPIPIFRRESGFVINRQGQRAKRRPLLTAPNSYLA